MPKPSDDLALREARAHLAEAEAFVKQRGIDQIAAQARLAAAKARVVQLERLYERRAAMARGATYEGTGGPARLVR